MAKKKGFLHITETIIVVLLIFVVLFQFSTIPRVHPDWGRVRLIYVSNDLLHSLHKSGIDWFDTVSVDQKIKEALSGLADFTLGVQIEVRPEIRVGCICDAVNFTILQREILTDFDLNGLRRKFTLQRIDPAHRKFSATNDVTIFWGDQSLTPGETRDLKDYLNKGNGVVEFTDISEADAGQGWHQDIFNLEWVPDSSYIPTANASFQLFLPTDNGYKVKNYYFSTPYDPSAGPSMMGYWKMNIGGGGTLKDISGNGNNGILYNGANDCIDYDEDFCPKWVEGKFGTALGLEGSNDYVIIESDNSLVVTDQLTIAAWVKQAVNNKGYVLAKGGDSNIFYYSMLSNSIQNRIEFDYNTLAGPVSVRWTGIVVDDDEWHHLVITVDGTDAYLYVDGQNKGQKTLSDNMVDDRDTDIYLGRKIPSGFAFKGTIDEIMLYNRALSPEEVNELFERKFDSTDHKFSNFVSGKLYPIDDTASKVVVEQESRYVGGIHNGDPIPLATINWAVEGKGRTAWMSSAPLTENSRQLLKSLVIWSAGEKEYNIIGGELKEGVRASLYTVLDGDMYEPMRVDLTIGYHY